MIVLVDPLSFRSRALPDGLPFLSLETSETPLQIQLDGLAGSFTAQATDGRSLASMIIGGAAYRLGQIGMTAVGMGGLTSAAFGLGAEVSAFELTHRTLQSLGTNQPNLWRWNGDGGIRQGLLTSLITFGSLRGAGRVARGENLVIQHALQDSVMVLSRNVSGRLNPTQNPRGSLTAQFLHAEATNLQLGAGMALGSSLTGGRVHAIERGLDVSLESTALAGSGSPVFIPESPVLEGPQILHMASIRPNPTEGSAPSQPVDMALSQPPLPLRQRFGPILSAGIRPSDSYATEILDTVLSTPSDIPRLHEQWLETLAERPDRGTVVQLYLARTLHEALASRPLQNSTRSFREALIHSLCAEIFSDGNRSRSRTALHRLFDTLNGGPTHEGFQEIFREFGYGREGRAEAAPIYDRDFYHRHSPYAAKQWNHFAPAVQLMLFNHVYRLAPHDSRRAEEIIAIFGEAGGRGPYPMEEVRRVIEVARTHPQGRLILNRLLQILTAQDLPEKLRELSQGSFSLPDTLSLFDSFGREGLSPEQRVERINGTEHNAFFNDRRLARKVVSVMGEVHRLSRESPDERGRALRGLFRAYEHFVRSGLKLDPKNLLELMQYHPSEQVDSLVQAYRRGGFQIVFLTGEEFDRRIAEWGQSPNCRIGFFKQGMDPDEAHEIFIREMPPIDTSTPEADNAAFAEITYRMKSLIHEWEHWRHATGNYEGLERGSEPISLSRIDRRERLISEIMAYLEEFRWRFLNMKENDFAQIAQRLGEPLPLFLRNYADHSYFSRTNSRLMKELLGEG